MYVIRTQQCWAKRKYYVLVRIDENNKETKIHSSVKEHEIIKLKEDLENEEKIDIV